jgi:hypothetical protein
LFFFFTDPVGPSKATNHISIMAHCTMLLHSHGSNFHWRQYSFCGVFLKFSWLRKFLLLKILESGTSGLCLTTQVAEIRRIAVQRQPRHNTLKDPVLKKPFTKKGWCSGSRCRPWVQTPVHKGKNIFGCTTRI